MSCLVECCYLSFFANWFWEPKFGGFLVTQYANNLLNQNTFKRIKYKTQQRNVINLLNHFVQQAFRLHLTTSQRTNSLRLCDSEIIFFHLSSYKHIKFLIASMAAQHEREKQHFDSCSTIRCPTWRLQMSLLRSTCPY